MTRNEDLNRMEGRLFATYFQDGLWDIMIGILMLAIAIRSFIDHWSISLIGIAGVIFAIVMRKFVTMKRLGYAKFGTRRRKKRKLILMVILAANFITLLILIIGFIGVEPSAFIAALVIGGMVMITFSTVAYLLNYWRFLLWGILFSIGIIMTEFTGMESGKYFFLAIGIAIVSVGLIYFMTFLKKYPGSKEVPANAA
jgi:hypothetical protein